MWDNRRTRIYIGFLIFLVIFAIVLIYENRVQDVYNNVDVSSQNIHSMGKKELKDDPLENWKGRWIPSRPREYTPPPKIFHKKNEIMKEDKDPFINWKGKWMPSRPGEYTPPPKIFHKKNEIVKEDNISEDPLVNWKGKWMPSRPGEYTPPPKIFHKKNETIRKDDNDEDSLENWKGRWIPSRPGEYKPPPKIFHTKNETDNHSTYTPPLKIYHKENTTQQVFLSNNHTRFINLGRYYLCDNGLNNLEVDWDHSTTSYTCFGKKIVPDSSILPEYYCDTIPKNYKAEHRCMAKTIEYVEDIPTFGTSRPVWPAYGEYKYLPVQRWLHSLENGAIVLLYHPCANTLEVENLKRLIKRCLSRYVISPNNFLDEERPLVLLSWGCKLSMPYVNENLVKKFISDNAINDRKGSFENGNYVDQLVEKAKIVSGNEDNNLCIETDKTHI